MTLQEQITQALQELLKAEAEYKVALNSTDTPWPVTGLAVEEYKQELQQAKERLANLLERITP